MKTEIILQNNTCDIISNDYAIMFVWVGEPYIYDCVFNGLVMNQWIRYKHPNQHDTGWQIV